MATTTTADQVVAAMDELVSGLLDIGEDINAAVVWLAEHWSADLPAPRWYATGDQHHEREALQLLVCCDADQLARIGDLAGVAPVDDPCEDDLGCRDRRVRYRFGTGRVELHAFAEIDPETDR